jgi:DNA-binding response OmpR family regulator
VTSNILVVDDDKDISKLLEIYLINEGYKVYKASDGVEALEVINIEDIHLVILDIMMPRLNGIEVCKKIRENLNIPILMLSAKSEDLDKIQGIMTGADDYMTKPFNTLELIVRVKALLRRSYYFNHNSNNNKDIIKINSLIINKSTHKVSVNDNDISLTSTEFDILHLLASNLGRIFSAEEIFERVWKEKYHQSNNTVMVHVSRLRDKLESAMDGEKIIHTVWGVGYKIER